MADFRDAIAETAGNLACQSARSIRTLSQAVANLPGGIFTQPPSDGAFLLERLYCNKDPYTQPFTPADCPIRYTVTITARSEGNANPAQNGTFTNTGVRWGPLGAPVVRRFESGDNPPSDRAGVDLLDYGDGNLPRQGSPSKVQFIGLTALSPTATYVVLGMTARPFPEGSSNSCELSPPVPYNPLDHTYDVPVTYTPPGGVAVTVPFIAVVGLFFVDVNGQVNMPITLNIKPNININLPDGFKVQATLNLTTGDTQIDWVAGDEPNTPPPALPPSSQPPITSPTNPAPPKPPAIPPVEPDPDDAPQGREMIGVLVTSTYNGNNSNVGQIFQTDSPNVFIPYLGLVSFAVRAAGDVTGWTNDIPVKNQRAFIPAPKVPGVIAVRGTPRAPNTWTLTPIYQKVVVLAGGQTS